MFKTPPYWNGDIDRPVPVMVQLVRMSDQESSDPKPFTYYPQQRGKCHNNNEEIFNDFMHN